MKPHVRRVLIWGTMAVLVTLACWATADAWGVEGMERQSLSIREESSRTPGTHLRTRLLGGGLHHGK